MIAISIVMLSACAVRTQTTVLPPVAHTNVVVHKQPTIENNPCSSSDLWWYGRWQVDEKPSFLKKVSRSCKHYRSKEENGISTNR